MTDVIDLEAVKAKQQATWAAGNYAVIGTTLQLVGEELCEALDVQAGWRVLDVAAGNGNASLAAARRGCEVTATDYVEELLAGTRRRAEAEGLTLATEVADAEALPFEDGTFDAVLSTFGVMFTPNHEQAAAELLRVCRPGGRIGLANWAPDGFIGSVFKVIGAHNPPPAGVPSPMAWGSEARLQELLGGGGDVTVTRKQFTFRYRSPAHFVEVFETFYGPMLRAFEAVGDRGAALREDLVQLTAAADRSTGTALAVPSDYLEVVVTRRPSRAPGG